MPVLALLADGQSAPYLGGGFGHFYAYAPEKWEYPIDRYAMEVKRQLDVLDRNLASRPFLCGEDYNIADMATYPWYGQLVLNGLYDSKEFLQVDSYKNVVRWARDIHNRPAVKRGRRVNRVSKSGVSERHDASDLDVLPGEQGGQGKGQQGEQGERRKQANT